MKEYKVYMYKFPNGKIYIGATSMDLADRRDCGYNHNKPLKSAMREYGWKNIEKVILADGLSESEAFELEREYIEKLRSTDENVGYNISLGGKSTFAGLKHTDESKKRMSDLYLGRTFSDETLERMKEAHTPERKPVFLVTPNKAIERRFDSLADAADYVSGFKSNISRACKNGKPYKGFYWRFANERG